MTDGYYKCDRCGEFEKGPQEVDSIMTDDYAAEEYRRFKYGYREDTDRGIIETIDLCEPCRRDLADFLDGETDE